MSKNTEYLFNNRNDKNSILEQYKLYYESIEKNSDRRNFAFNLFITINIALMWAIGYIMLNLENSILIILLLSFLGIIIAIIFWFLLNSYKQLNTWKFAVMHEIEKELPLNLFKYEWDILWKWKDKSKYFPFSHIEINLPKISFVLYLWILIWCVVKRLMNLTVIKLIVVL